MAFSISSALSISTFLWTVNKSNTKLVGILYISNGLIANAFAKVYTIIRETSCGEPLPPLKSLPIRRFFLHPPLTP